MLHMTLCLLVLQLLHASIYTKLETQDNTNSRLASITRQPTLHNNSEDNRHILRNKLSDLRHELMQLFNKHTPDQSLHFRCFQRSGVKTSRCQTQFTWEQQIKTTKEKDKLSAARDKAVFEQLKLLIKTNDRMRQVFTELKQTEQAYLRAK
ncbi:hypothetical protein [Glaciecola petra]|uniref:Uncharacterized protein n=1 Tax=Glaciecola petra TaxID=3075602 RepID=A0ABU2ZS62_9ALTE|nr:hypothetical protein [Aestuariibacter sp. P117]MDT0595469.1 hypothetical protein [Aestuariibacter sp. P117]